jgi:Peptidase family M28
MQQPPHEDLSREEELVDEAGVETFPASDAPGWNPTHAGAPAHREVVVEHGHEVLRTMLRVDVERLSRRIEDPDERRRAREEIVSRALLGAGRAVVREPVDQALRVRTLESEQLGAVREASCVIFGARYDGDDISGIAALLSLSRGLAHLRLRRNVRFVAFADAANVSGSATYAERLWTGGVGVHAMVSLARLDLARDHEASLLFVGSMRTRHLLRVCADMFGTTSRITARAIALPSWFPGLRSADHVAFRRHGWPAVMVADGPPWRIRSAGAPDVDRIAAAVPGLVSVATRLAGGA